MDQPYVHQFRTTDDLRELIKQFRFFARSVPAGHHATLYTPQTAGPGDELVEGLRIKDWLLSTDKAWVLASAAHGLSFSAHWQHLKDVYKLKKRHAKQAPVNVYWVLQTADIPPGMAFVADPNNEQHFLLTVTERMTIWKLIEKLQWVADRMSVMHDMGKVL